jgi:hypothetical protein
MRQRALITSVVFASFAEFPPTFFFDFFVCSFMQSSSSQFRAAEEIGRVAAGLPGDEGFGTVRVSFRQAVRAEQLRSAVVEVARARFREEPEDWESAFFIVQPPVQAAEEAKDVPLDSDAVDPVVDLDDDDDAVDAAIVRYRAAVDRQKDTAVEGNVDAPIIHNSKIQKSDVLTEDEIWRKKVHEYTNSLVSLVTPMQPGYVYCSFEATADVTAHERSFSVGDGHGGINILI